MARRDHDDLLSLFGNTVRARRTLDMSCRVAGCKKVSRGPRFGFICDEHRKKLSAKDQRDAREKWKTARAKKAA